MRPVSIAVALASCLLPAAASSAATLPNAGGPSLVIGADGLGLVAYQDLADRDLEVAHCVDAACSAVTIATVDAPGDVGSRASIALRPNGLPVVSYVDATGGVGPVLKLALCSDALCTTSTNVPIDPDLRGGGQGATAVAIGADGFPLVAYTAGAPPGATNPFNGELRVAHCNDAFCGSVTRTTLGESLADFRSGVSLEIGGDGLGLIASSRSAVAGIDTVDIRHCSNAACTLATPRPASEALLPSAVNRHPSIAIAPGGLAAYSTSGGGSGGPPALYLARCPDAQCTPSNFTEIPADFAPGSLAIDASNRPRLVGRAPITTHTELHYIECADATCTTRTQTCFAPWGDYPSLALDAAGAPLVAFERGRQVEVTPPTTACTPMLFASDNRVLEDASFPPDIQIRLGPLSSSPVSVSFTTSDGTAVAGADYFGGSGTLTIPAGTNGTQLTFPVVHDAVSEPDETFLLTLSSPVGATIANALSVTTIVDDDRRVYTGDCAIVEGNSGTRDCLFEIRMSNPASQAMLVSYSTSDGTASAGVDYIAHSGTVTFAPGTTTQSVTVSIVGDLAFEADETFRFLVTNPPDADPGDLEGAGVILDDDGPAIASQGLVHASSIVADFAADPGPTADRDDYRLVQPPYSSHEIVLDGVSGDAAPGAFIARVANDGVTVLQTSTPVSTGPAVALRFRNDLSAEVDTQYIRVLGASCATGCGTDDTYRLRAYETTGFIPRFNNTASQATVLILQNTTGRPVSAIAHFWSPTGARLDSREVVLPPYAVDVLLTATRPNLVGSSGAITIAHDAGYGALVGKAVALEPATGFSFDSPMVVKPR